MNSSASTSNKSRQCSNQNIQVFVRVRPLNDREKTIRSSEVVNVVPPKEIVARHALEAKLTKKFTFDRTFAPESTQVEVYNAVVAPLTEEVLAGYNCTVFAYGQTGTGKTHTMVGNELATLSSAWDDNSEIGIIPRSLCHLFDELRMMQMQFTMRVSYLELYNEELCDLLSSDDNTAKIRIYDDSSKKGCVIINGLEEVTVNSKDDVYKLLEKGQERRKTAKTLMNAQSSRSHTVFSIVVHMRETDMVTNEEMVKIGKLNLVDLAGSENVSKAGNEKPIRVRETVNINQSLLTLGRVITALVERTPHVPYRESKLTRLLQESLGGRTKTAIIATISPGHKDIEETLSTLEYAHRAKNIQNKPEVNQKLSQRAMLTQYTEEIERLKRELTAAREKNGIYLTEESYVEMTSKMESQSRELNEKSSLVKSLRDDIATKDRLFSEVSLKLVEESAAHVETKSALKRTQTELEQLKQSFQRTKRRYIEKKMLLYEHMKTEQELTTQATQVLQVADEATEDISKLFETIEERKSVDAKIANASERLVLQVNNNFNEIDQQILTARKQNDKLIKMTIDEIKEATEHQEALHKETGDKLLKIRANFVAKTEEIMHMQRQNYERMLNMHENDNETSREQMKLLLEKTDAFAQEMLNELHTLQHNSEQEKLALQDLLAKSEEQQQRRSASNAAHGMVLQQEISRLKLALSGSLQNLRSVKAQMIEQKQAQSHLERQMSKFFEKSRLGVMETLINGLWNNTKSHEDLLDDCATMAQAYCKEQDETDKYAFNDTVNYIEQRQAIVTQQIGTMCDLGEQTRQHVEQHKEILEHSYKQHEIHNETLANHAASELTSLQDQLKSTAVELEESQDSLQAYVHNQCQFVNERHTLSGSLLCSLQTDVWDKLNDQYAALRNSCVKNVTEIKQTELKTYEPTGQTPSKRDMKYPRVLSRTSPHDTLIKRFRLENNDTDMDLSQTIVEDSDETLEDTQSILPDLEENLLNSTPLQEDNLERTSSDNVLTSSENMDTTELSRKRSSSTVILDVENSRNKENNAL